MAQKNIGKADFFQMIQQAGLNKQRVAVYQQGRAVAYVVPIEDVQTLQRLEDRLDGAECERILRRVREGKEKVLSWEQAKSRL
ncbi:MAG: hypothetical protein AAF471_07520 [Myxococcota bacterium]